MTKFNVGDRVNAYRPDVTPVKAVVEEISSDGLLFVRAIDTSFVAHYFFHPRQCRKLKPKVKPVPREIIVTKEDAGMVTTDFKNIYNSFKIGDKVTFREVLK